MGLAYNCVTLETDIVGILLHCRDKETEVGENESKLEHTKWEVRKKYVSHTVAKVLTDISATSTNKDELEILRVVQQNYQAVTNSPQELCTILAQYSEDLPHTTIIQTLTEQTLPFAGRENEIKKLMEKMMEILLSKYEIRHRILNLIGMLPVDCH
jgi:hypothetical protein